MADTFTDGTEDFSEVLLSPDPDEGSAETSETVPEVSEQPALSVPSEQDAVDHEAVSSDDVAASSGEETAEGVETISSFGTVEQIDYTELLQQQNMYLSSLVAETRETNERLSDLNHAMPIVSCMFGFVVGVLLVQIFSSYLRI